MKKDIKIFWTVKYENYDKINELSGSIFTAEKINDLKISSMYSKEFNLTLWIEDGKKIFYDFSYTKRRLLKRK